MKREDIENATTSITIHVPRDISKRTRNPQECALAEACKKDVRIEEAVIHVSTAYIKFKGEEKWKCFRVPRARGTRSSASTDGAFTDGDLSWCRFSRRTCRAASAKARQERFR